VKISVEWTGTGRLIDLDVDLDATLGEVADVAANELIPAGELKQFRDWYRGWPKWGPITSFVSCRSSQHDWVNQCLPKENLSSSRDTRR
jgi:hypothetical protein